MISEAFTPVVLLLSYLHHETIPEQVRPESVSQSTCITPYSIRHRKHISLEQRYPPQGCSIHHSCNSLVFSIFLSRGHLLGCDYPLPLRSTPYSTSSSVSTSHIEFAGFDPRKPPKWFLTSLQWYSYPIAHHYHNSGTTHVHNKSPSVQLFRWSTITR